VRHTTTAALLAPCFLTATCREDPMHSSLEPSVALRGVPAAVWARLASRRIFFLSLAGLEQHRNRGAELPRVAD
jgi:hypothetical protein